MSVRLVPHEERWRGAVRDLNVRAAARGGWGFFEDPVPRWLPPAPEREIFREYFVAIEDGDAARGGYVLKREPARVDGGDALVASVQGPYSEGAVDPQHAKVTFALARDISERSAFAYGWGLEGREDSVLRLFHALGWRSRATQLLLWLGPPALSSTRRSSKWRDLYAEVPAFGAWADTLWEANADRYAFAVRRTKKVLCDLYPAERPEFRRLQVHRRGEVVGWALVGSRKFNGHPRFGSAHTGVIWDFFAAPEDAHLVVSAALHALQRSGACAVLASTLHDAWINGFRSNGFRLRRERRHWLVSNALASRLQPFEQRAADCLLTFGDGESYFASTLGQAIFGKPPSSSR
jgi:hypothetical protein